MMSRKTPSFQSFRWSVAERAASVAEQLGTHPTEIRVTATFARSSLRISVRDIAFGEIFAAILPFGRIDVPSVAQLGESIRVAIEAEMTRPCAASRMSGGTSDIFRNACRTPTPVFSTDKTGNFL
jgi:hypothetical protein